MATIGHNTTGTALTVNPETSRRNVNGDNWDRPALRLWNAADGTSFDINTINIQSNEVIEIAVFGFTKI